jgi:hypothetical protein
LVQTKVEYNKIFAKKYKSLLLGCDTLGCPSRGEGEWFIARC